MVADGRVIRAGAFVADTILAKHDMPPQVAGKTHKVGTPAK